MASEEHQEFWRYSAFPQEMVEHRGWMVGLGIVIFLLGLMLLSASVMTSFFTVGLLGVFLLLSGGAQIIHAFWVKKWGGFFLSLFGGLFLLLLGLFILSKPLISLSALTLLLAIYFFTAGIAKSVFAISARFRNWGWLLFSGLVSIFLGLVIWGQWPLSSLYIIGVLVGIYLIFFGISWTAIGLSIGSARPHRTV